LPWPVKIEENEMSGDDEAANGGITFKNVLLANNTQSRSSGGA